MKAAQKIIESRLTNLKIDLEAENKFGEKVKDGFCDVWPHAEKGVIYAMAAFKNPIAKWLLGLALVLLKSVEAKNCPK
ncbi:MAG: hypothetical protein AABY22_10930 [Nanoarchaeota archaeon]